MKGLTMPRKERRAAAATGDQQTPAYTTVVFGEGMDTTVRDALAMQRFYGLSHIVPDWNGEAGTLEEGALHLIAEPPARIRAAFALVHRSSSRRLNAGAIYFRRDSGFCTGYVLRVIPAAVAKECSDRGWLPRAVREERRVIERMVAASSARGDELNGDHAEGTGGMTEREHLDALARLFPSVSREDHDAGNER